jgi:cell division protein FtsW
VAEETGILGGLFLVIMFALLIWRGLVIAKNAPDQLGSLIAFGLTAWIGLEALMNMAVMVGLMPFHRQCVAFYQCWRFQHGRHPDLNRHYYEYF